MRLYSYRSIRIIPVLLLCILFLLLTACSPAPVSSVVSIVSSPVTESSAESSSVPSTVSEVSSVPSTVSEVPPTSPLGCVVIDPGHGYDDEGASGGFLDDTVMEKDITLQISLYLQQELADCGVEVIMLRDSDTPPENDQRNENGSYTLTPQERVEMANATDADLYISIHCNYFDSDTSVSGVRLYQYADAPEQTADYIAYLQQSILDRIDTSQARTFALANGDAYYVTRFTSMPSVLVETGFITNEQDAARLQNPAYQQQMAKALAEGIVCTLQDEE